MNAWSVVGSFFLTNSHSMWLGFGKAVYWRLFVGWWMSLAWGFLGGCFRAEGKGLTPRERGWIAGGLSADEDFRGHNFDMEVCRRFSCLRFGVFWSL